jgi:HK97 family phage major capsid protein
MLADLQEQRGQKIDALKAIVSKAETERRDLSEQETTEFNAGKKEIEALEERISRAQFLADAERRAEATPVGAGGDRKFNIECRKYSLIKAIAAQAGLNVDASRECEISAELERRNGLKAQGIFAPMQIFEKRVTTTTGAPGGSNIIATDLLAGQFIDLLRDALATQRLGARILNGLVGNAAIPRLKTGASGTWIAENAGLTAADGAFDQVTLSPKTVGALIEISRLMLMQSTPDVEGIVRNDFAQMVARAIDKVALVGGGVSEPTGVLSTAGIGDVAGGTNGLAPTWANIIALIGTIAGNNALAGSLGFASNAKFTTKCCSVLKSTGDTTSNFIMETPGDGTLAGYPIAMTNLVPSNLVKGASGAVCSALIFGDFSDLLIGYWSAFDLLVNPYESTAYTKGNVQVRAMATCDVAIRQPKSFAAIKDLLTT